MKIVLKAILSLIIAFVFLYLAFKDLQFEKVLSVLQGTKISFLALAILLDFVVLGIRSYRWRWIISQHQPVKFSNTFAATIMGVSVGNIFPVRLDEIIRTLLLSRKEALPKVLVVGSIMIERLWDLIVLFCVLLALSFLIPFPEWLQTAETVVLIVMSSLFVLVGCISFFKEGSVRLISKTLTFFSQGRSKDFQEQLSLSLSVLGLMKTKKGLLVPPLYSIVEWLFGIAFVKVILFSLGLDIPTHLCLFILAANYLSFAFLLSPAAIGSFEFINIFLLVNLLGRDPASSMGFILLMHLMLSVPVTLCGIGLFLKEGLSVRDLTDTHKT